MIVNVYLNTTWSEHGLVNVKQNLAMHASILDRERQCIRRTKYSHIARLPKLLWLKCSCYMTHLACSINLS